MKCDRVLSKDDTRDYFVKRARDYNYSARWVDDKILIKKIYRLATASPKAKVLDIGIGTGRIAQAFHGKVNRVVGIDICKEMTKQARGTADRIILSSAEKLPFKDNSFDVCVCRQGLQFMKLKKVLSEIYRVLKPRGTVVLCHLSAYGQEDREETFLIQKLRNPARKNFFLPEDFTRFLKEKNFIDIKSFEYLTRESTNRWIANSAISNAARREIRETYRKASKAFKKIHNIQFKEGDIFDSMKMVIVKARKRGR